MSQAGDSISMYGLNGLSGYLDPPKTDPGMANEYTGKTNLKVPASWMTPFF